VASSELIEALDRLPRTQFEDVAVRHIAPGYLPLSGEGARVHGGRWNPPGSFAVLYTALDRATMLGELERAARRQGLSIGDLLPRNEVTYDVFLTRVLDLRDASNRAAVGLSEEDIADDNWSQCQEVGDAAHYVGFDAILSPSAIGSGETLAIFLDLLIAATRLEVVSTAEMAVPSEP
jgi:RES domain-containing protein